MKKNYIRGINEVAKVLTKQYCIEFDIKKFVIDLVPKMLSTEAVNNRNVLRCLKVTIMPNQGVKGLATKKKRTFLKI